MSLNKILGLALAAVMIVPLAACEDTTQPPPPPPAPQIPTVERYVKRADSGTNQQIGLQNNDVYDLLVASNNTLWVGNQEGVALFGTVDNGVYVPVRTAAYDQNNGLPNPKVRTLVESDGRIYVGTWGGGIGVFDVAAGNWVDVIDTGDGLINDLVADLAVDDDGSIIAATNGGASRYDPATGGITNYRRIGVNTIGDLLDEFVSAVVIANTPRGKEYWYMPRWESGIDPGTEGQHGITVTRGQFNAPSLSDTLSPAQDNTLYEDPEGTVSNGAGDYFLTGVGSDGLMRRALVKFDLTGVVPADATVLSARLRVRNTTAGFSDALFEVRRVNRDWGEGTSDAPGGELTGAPATPGDATWKHTFYPDDEWRRLGGDYSPDASGIIQVRGSGSYSIARAAMAEDVQFWSRNPAENYGWIITNPDSLKRLASRENPSISARPSLEVTYARFMYFTEVTTDFPDPNVNDVFYDETNDLFYIAFSTEGLGVVDVGESTWRFYTMDDGLPSNVVYSITEVGGVIWVGTQDGIARQMTDGSFRSYNRSGGIPADRVRRVYSDSPDRLWLGLVEAGAALVDPNRAE